MKEALKVYVPVALLALILVVVITRFIAPPPPKAIVFAAGGADGQYYALAQDYTTRLAEHGIEVTVLETAGTVENYALLENGEADVALLQGGIAGDVERGFALSLGGMFPEPFWIFTRSDADVADFGDLRAMTLASGPEGSGTRALANMLKAEWGGVWPTPSEDSGARAVAALKQGRVDAAVFATSVQTPYLQALLRDNGVQLFSMQRAEALSMRYPALTEVTLFEGVVDLANNRPAQDVTLVAAVAQLGVRSDLHPAIQAVLLEAAEPIHGGGSILTRAGAFPDMQRVDLPLSDEASRYYRNGPTFLRRYFSFGVANFLERAWVFLIPLVAILIPLVQMAPPVYRWRIRRKIYVWYNDLHELEHRGIEAPSAAERQAVLDEIHALQMEVGRVDVPVSYNDELYHLRSHINFVEALVARQKVRSG